MGLKLADAGIAPITRDDILGQVYEAAKSRLGIGGEELIEQYCTSGVERPGPVADVLILLDLLDPEDPVFTEHRRGRTVCTMR